jgi:sulfite reductase (NADPH) flavoprotein alpha-component
VDYDTPAEEWYLQVETEMRGVIVEDKPVVAAPAKKAGKKFFEGTIVKSINLNDRGSDKETFHIEITSEEEMDYDPGDSIAIIPANAPYVVDNIIANSGVEAGTEVTAGKFTGTIRDLLLNKLNICYLLTSTVKKYAALTGHVIPDMRLDLVDLLRIYPLQNKEQFTAVLNILNPIAPRLYSVSSAASAGNREVHITVSRHRFMAEDEQKYGLCSSFLGDLPVNSRINFYIHRNRAFKLPADDTDIIMVGPGTGIAPFRSFLIERDIKGAGGKSWLFFGEQHFQTDFLYQIEIQQYVQTGVLSKVSLAFSRDQQEKNYVQHRMYEQREELYQWLLNGAVFYVSGTKDPMSVDVEAMLLRIIRETGKKSEQEAIAFLDQLKKEDRYHKDVY